MVHRNQDVEFSFWASCETESQAIREDEVKYYPSSPLLSLDHHPYYTTNLSPRSRRQAIEDGRRELMDMVKDMPESGYELSLKDLVDQHHPRMVKEEEEEVVVHEQKSFKSSIEESQVEKENMMKMKKKTSKKRNLKGSQIPRSGTMDDEFLLKMYFPTSIGSVRKEKRTGFSKVSPTPRPISSDGYEVSPHTGNQWWMIKSIYLAVTKRSSSSPQSMSRSTSDGSSNQNRHDDDDDDNSSLSGCWFFFNSKRSKKEGKKGIFWK